MQNQDQQIDEILSSLSGIQRADCSPFLYEEVMQRIHQKQAGPSLIYQFRWQIAVLALMLILNTFFVLGRTEKETLSTPDANFARVYFGNNSVYNY